MEAQVATGSKVHSFAVDSSLTLLFFPSFCNKVMTAPD